MPPTAKSGRRGGRAPRLTIEQVIETAMLIADQEGLAGLTMQRIAAELGVGAMTLYGYVRTKEEIYDGIGARLCAEVLDRVDPAGPWQQTLASTFTDLHATLRTRPGALELVLTTHLLSGPAMEELDRSLTTSLEQAGFAPEQASSAVEAALSFTVGSLAVEHARNPGGAPAPPASAFEVGLTHVIRAFAEPHPDR